MTPGDFPGCKETTARHDGPGDSDLNLQVNVRGALLAACVFPERMPFPLSSQAGLQGAGRAGHRGEVCS
jgi:hypothetical protein